MYLKGLENSDYLSTDDDDSNRLWILDTYILINPRSTEGYSSCLVRLCVNLSVTTLTAAYLVYRLKARCH